MSLARLEVRGREVIPQTVLDRLGLEGGEALLVEVSEDGAILLRPVGAYRVELYRDERVPSSSMKTSLQWSFGIVCGRGSQGTAAEDRGAL